MFPPVPNPEALKTIVRDDAALRDGVAAVCARHGLATEPMARLPGGSVPVYGVGEGRVLKLFPPGEHAYAQTEWRALLATHGRLPLPIPEPIATGTADGWSYVLMSRLRGRLLVHAWPEGVLSSTRTIATASRRSWGAASPRSTPSTTSTSVTTPTGTPSSPRSARAPSIVSARMDWTSAGSRRSPTSSRPHRRTTSAACCSTPS